MYKGQKVSVVFPAYNEEENIVNAVNEAFAVEFVDEVLVVNNNSKDKTEQLVKTTKARLVNENTQGYGSALTRGLKDASGEIIILCEPDNTFVMSDILKLLSYCDDFDMVLGTRTTRELLWAEANMGWFLRVGNIMVAKLLEVLFSTPSLSDCGCTFRLVKVKAAKLIVNNLTVKGSHFLPEMVIVARRNGVNFVEIPLNYKGRRGTSKITGTLKGTIKTGMNMILLILKYRIKYWFNRFLG
ncbi:MAG: glycosyltransferase family 2 protein [Planctomycetes bacterium]|nr:glycosyltransferase family 2 protein [Planctomycetota bacterium]